MARRPHRSLPTSRVRAVSRAPRALSVFLVALGLLFLQGPRLFHLLLISHTTCEHGELVEVASDSKHTAIDVWERDSEQDRADAGHGEDAGHDHCDALALRHLPSDIAKALGAPSLLTIEPRAVLSSRDGQRPVQILSLAPKGSPPAA